MLHLLYKSVINGKGWGMHIQDCVQRAVMSCASLIIIGAFWNGKAFWERNLYKCKVYTLMGGLDFYMVRCVWVSVKCEMCMNLNVDLLVYLTNSCSIMHFTLGSGF
jgi:hypothetical protein